MGSKRIAFQGAAGAYSEEAIVVLDPHAQSQPYREFRDVTQAVVEHRADLGLLPIENSVVGSIAQNFDLIAESGLAIVGEVVTSVHHCLLGGRGAPGRPLARGDRWCARRRALRPRDPRGADRGRAAQPNAFPACGGGGGVAAGRGGGEDHAVAQAAAPSRDVGARARAHRGGGLEPDEAREPSRSDDAVGVPVLPGRGSAGRGPGDGRRHPGSRSAGRGGDRPRRLPAVYAARLTIARHAKYTGTPITTTPSPSAL